MTDSPEPIIDQMDQETSERRDSSTTPGDNALITRIKRISADSRRVMPINRGHPDLITDMSAQEDMNFWNSLVIAKSDFNYEPVGLAGSAVSGNRTANLSRFGVPVYTKPATGAESYTTDESVKTVSSKSSHFEKTSMLTGDSSSSSRANRHRTFSSSSAASPYVLDSSTRRVLGPTTKTTTTDSSSDAEPRPNRVLVPLEFIGKKSF